MSPDHKASELGFGEFVALMALMISLVALSIDAMLPALPHIGRDLNLANENDSQLVVSALALVRDMYEGRAMARVMSCVMAVFILVPAIAPALGQGILLVAGWRVIFGVFLALTIVTFLWFAIRQEETLARTQRIPFSVGKLIAAIGEVCANRTTLGYTVAAGLIFGVFVGYLSSAQQIFQGQYNLGRQFPIYFAVLALSIGGASIFNARLVMKRGMRWMSYWSLLVLSSLSSAVFVIAYLLQGNPSLWLLMTYLMVAFFCTGIMFGNLNALAMEPLGHIAGVGATVVGSLSTLISIPLGVYIGASYDGTVLPLIAGFAVLGTASLFVVRWIERGTEPRKFNGFS